jgi:hypothetical protein
MSEKGEAFNKYSTSGLKLYIAASWMLEPSWNAIGAGQISTAVGRSYLTPHLLCVNPCWIIQSPHPSLGELR